MNDRELLEMAAKTAGIPSRLVGAQPGLYWCEETKSCMYQWNPLADDGDALRLAVKLHMSVDIDEHETSTYAYAGKSPRVYAMEIWHSSPTVATRRAIVRAAAELGRNK